MVRELLKQNKVDVNIMDDDGETALIVASKKGHLEVVRALLDHDDVDVNIEDNDGCTALDVARNNDNQDVAHLLEERMRVER
jgi:ankyrin repeat protein